MKKDFGRGIRSSQISSEAERPQRIFSYAVDDFYRYWSKLVNCEQYISIMLYFIGLGLGDAKDITVREQVLWNIKTLTTASCLLLVRHIS